MIGTSFVNTNFIIEECVHIFDLFPLPILHHPFLPFPHQKMMRLYQLPLFHFILANFPLLILILITFSTQKSSQFEIRNLHWNSSQNQKQIFTKPPRMKCFISVIEDENVWRLSECPSNKQNHWCIKLIDSENDFQIRDCDPGYCQSFGERCGPGEEANSTSILPKSTLCCCQNSFGCNKANPILTYSTFYLFFGIIIFSFFPFQYF